MRMSRRLVRLALALLVAPAWSACHKSASSPPTPSQTTTSVPVQAVAAVTIAGNGPLARIGDTIQLTGTARYTDNSTKDVTSEGTWTTGDQRVLSISRSGLVTAVGFGATYVSFVYQSHGAGLQISATPAGTFVISGRVREPAAGGVAGATVVETLTGRSVTTDADGEFSVAELPQLHGHFRVDREGYEPAEIDAIVANIDLAMQRIVRIVAGESASPGALAPNDLSYVIAGEKCVSCRLIRVVVRQSGTLHVHVTWTLAAATLRLFAEGQVVASDTGDLMVDVPINAAREVILYLGAATPIGVPGHTSFTLETSMR
jgi:carboxypeptidase family protein/Big-like domain-containing protein